MGGGGGGGKRSQSPNVQESQGPRVNRSKRPKDPWSKGPRYLKVTFKYKLDSKEGPSCLDFLILTLASKIML